MSRIIFKYLLNLIKPSLQKQFDGCGWCTTCPDIQLLVDLWTMATPDSYR